MASVGKHIKQLRSVRHLTQEQLAEKLFVTRQAVSAWETGKALPDLETLERIAAALEAEVTEVIYGAPRSPDLRAVKRRWALIGGGLVMSLTILFLVLLQNGTIGTWIGGLSYHMGNPDYWTVYEDIPGSWSVELDLAAPESNVGKVLYKDDSGCHVVVDKLVDDGDGAFRVFFRSHGVYDRTGGQLVSGCIPRQVGSFQWQDTASPRAAAAAGELTRKSSLAGSTGMNWKDGNQFGFHLTADTDDDRYLSYEDVTAHGGTVTITVTGLTRMTTERQWYWAHF